MPSIGIGIGVHRKRKGSRWTPQSLVVEDAAPIHVVMTGNAANTNAIASDFTIAGFTVNSLSRDGTNKILTLTLSVAVLYFDNTLTVVYKGKSYLVINNVLDDGNSVVFIDTQSPLGVIRDINGAESIYWDLLTGSSGRSAEQSSGAIVLYAVYEITATQANFFYTGCQVGDIFPCGTVKTCDANNKVKRVLGNHATQPTLSKRFVNGIGDGVSQFMKTAPFTWNQPELIYICFRQISWATPAHIIDGNGLNGGALYQNGVSPKMSLYAGALPAFADQSLPIMNFGVVVAEFNTTSGTLTINNTGKVTGNTGANNMGGLTIGADGGNIEWANIELLGLIGRKTSDADGLRTSFYNCFLRKYSSIITTKQKFIATPTISASALSADNIISRTVLINSGTYHMFEENQHYPVTWSIGKRTSADGVSFSARSSDLLSAGAGGTFDEKGQADPTVIYDGPGDWKMWFDALNGAGVWDKLGYATSTDGATWAKYGSVLNRGAGGVWDDFLVHHPTVIRHNGIYYMFYTGAKATSPTIYKIGLATSTDGISWTKYASNPIISPTVSTFDSTTCRSSNPILINGIWYMWYWGSDGTNHSMGLATSTDLYHWGKVGKVLGNPAGSQGEIEPVATCALLMNDGSVKIYYSCYRGVVDNITVCEFRSATIP